MQTAVPDIDGFTAAQAGMISVAGVRHRDAGKVLGRIGSLEVRLARSEAEIEAAQKIRYRVFFEEMGARAGGRANLDRRDCDRFDAVCDHLLVFDTALAGPDHRRIVGTYRLLTAGGRGAGRQLLFRRRIRAEAVDRAPSRASASWSWAVPACCRNTAPSAPSKCLWQGIWAYVTEHSIGVMAGCASFHGTVPAAHAEALSYLAHHCRTGADFDIRAVPGRYASMDLMPVEAINTKSAIAGMPPLVKGYLRVGARIGDGCVIDHEFGTVDVFVVMPVKEIRQRYISYYGGDANRIAA